MARLTKAQIEYLENKLNRIVGEKMEDFKKELGVSGSRNQRIGDKLVQGLIAGEIKLLPVQELINKLENYAKTDNPSLYTPHLYVTDMVSREDRVRIEKEVESVDEKVRNYSDRLLTARQNVLDKVILEGIDIETAFAEINDITP